MTVIVNYTTMRATFATTATPVDPDGMEPWPYANVRASGFDDGFTGIGEPITAFPITVSVDSLNVGAVAHDAYLSQRTDVAASQYFTIVETATYSGTWTISLTSVGAAAIGNALTTDPVTPDQLAQATKYCALYVKRLSDAAIQWVSLYDATLGNG